MAKRHFSIVRRCIMALEAILIIPMVYVVSFFSFPAINSFSRFIGRIILLLAPGKIQEVKENLSIIHPDKVYSDKEIKSIAEYSQGFILRIFIELQKISRMNLQEILLCFRLDTPFFSHVYRLFCEKKPQTLFTLHSGNWELCGIMMGILGLDMLSVVERQFNPFLDQYYQNLRRKTGIQPVYNEISLMRPLLKSMKSGSCAVLVADQNYWHSPLFLPFFGREASAPKAATLALYKKSHYLCGASETLSPGRIRIFITKPQELQLVGDKNQDIINLTTKIYTFYEDVIRKNPQDWFLLSSARWRLTKEKWLEWAKNPDSDSF
ncbi:MAG: lysophospholipid acyltransferase family protein [Brevinema sp.]